MCRKTNQHSTANCIAATIVQNYQFSPKLFTKVLLFLYKKANQSALDTNCTINHGISDQLRKKTIIKPQLSDKRGWTLTDIERAITHPL